MPRRPEELETTDTYSPVYDPQIQLDQEAFLTQLHAYVRHLQTQNRMNQAVALTEAVHELDANKWCCAVHSDLQEKLISQDKDLLPFLRTKLEIPQLFLELSIAEASPTESSAKPYTPEEKLKAMAEKNPHLEKIDGII